jgi:hypothetical protein
MHGTLPKGEIKTPNTLLERLYLGGSRSSYALQVSRMALLGGACDSNRFHPVHVVNNFNFSINIYDHSASKLWRGNTNNVTIIYSTLLLLATLPSMHFYVFMTRVYRSMLFCMHHVCAR